LGISGIWVVAEESRLRPGDGIRRREAVLGLEARQQMKMVFCLGIFVKRPEVKFFHQNANAETHDECL
jgi:hypothetical protein